MLLRKNTVSTDQIHPRTEMFEMREQRSKKKKKKKEKGVELMIRPANMEREREETWGTKTSSTSELKTQRGGHRLSVCIWLRRTVQFG